MGKAEGVPVSHGVYLMGSLCLAHPTLELHVEQTSLKNRFIAVPESRELEVFGALLEKRGAKVLRCPLVSIHDSPNTEVIEAWLRQFVADPGDDIILLTGEGLRRLLGFAERAGGTLKEDFIAALSKVRKITRGPKPGNALRKIGLKTDLLGAAPTTDGVIETLSEENLRGRKISVQLYGSNPNTPLMEFLAKAGAVVSTVAPYIYADDSEDQQVLQLLDVLLAGELDAFTFTSTPQVKRLYQVADRKGLSSYVTDALNGLEVAAVGPVVADSLEELGVKVSLMPESNYFMKPLVRELEKKFS
jgi:uroporphyrinogen-III synthase